MATDHNFKVKNGLTVQGETLVVNHTGDLSGTQVYIKKKDSNTNLMRWGEGTSGQDTYRWRIDQEFELIGNSGSGDKVRIKSSDGSIEGQSYKVGTTEVIDSSRNLTDINSLRISGTSGIAIGTSPSGFGTGVSTILLQGTSSTNGRAGALWFKEYDGSDTTALYSTDGADGYGTVLAAYQGSLKLATGSLSGTALEINSSQESFFKNAVQIDSGADQILTLNQATTGWNYIGFESGGTRKFYLGNDGSDGFVLGSDVANKKFSLSQISELAGVPLITHTSDISIKPAAGQDVLLFNAHNSESQLRLYNNRQDLSNVPVSSIVAYNSAQVSKIQFYRGGGGSSGYINFQVKPQNGESLTDTFQIGDNNTVDYGVNVRAGGYRVGGTTVIDSSRNLSNIGTISTSGDIDAGGRVKVTNWLELESTGAAITTEEAGIRIDYNDTAAWYIYKDNANDAALHIQSAGASGEGDGTPRVRFNRTARETYFGGAVGINQYSITSGYSFDVNGLARITGKTSFGDRLEVHRGNSNVAAPNTADHDAGTRISFYDTSATAWYAMGIESDTLWFNSDANYKWYQDAALRMSLIGNHLLMGSVNTTGLSNNSIRANGQIDTADVTTGTFRVYDGSTFRGGFGTGQWASGDTGEVANMSMYAVNTLNLHAGNANTPKFTIDGNGILRSIRNTATTSVNGTFNVASTTLGNIHMTNGAGTSGAPKQAAITFQGDSATAAQAGIYVVNDNSSGTHMAFATTNSYAQGPQQALTIENDGDINLNRGSLRINGVEVLSNSRVLRNIASSTFIGTMSVDGSIVIDTDTGSQPFCINRNNPSATNSTQGLRIHVDDSYAVFISEQDEANRYGGYQFKGRHNGANLDRLTITAGNHSEVTMYANNGNGAWRWDGTNQRQGIGTTTPSYALDVSGAINSSNSYKISGNTVVDSAQRIYANGGSIQHSSDISFLNGSNGSTGSGAQGIRVAQIYVGTSYSNSAPTGMVNTLNGYQVGNTTIVNSSRDLINLGSISASTTATINADGGAGYTAARIRLKSHNDYRGAGVYMQCTADDDQWYAGTPYTDFDGSYIIAFQSAVSSDVDQTAQYGNAKFRVDSSGAVSIPSGGSLSVSGDITISGNGEELLFSGGNNRIKFNGYRAMEGTTDGANLYIAETYSNTTVMSNLNISSGYAFKHNGTTVVDNNRVVYGTAFNGTGYLYTAHKALDVLTINHTATPTQYLITTNIPYTNGHHMPTVKIQGYAYGEAETVDLTIVWYIYNGSFVSYSASSSGSWAPEISLAQNANGKVVIHLAEGHYYTKMSVSVESGLNMMNLTRDHMSGWSWSDAACPTANKVTVSYKQKLPGVTELNGGTLYFGSTDYGVNAGGHNLNSVYVDTLESGSSGDALELVYYQGPGVNIGNGATKYLNASTLGATTSSTPSGPGTTGRYTANGLQFGGNNNGKETNSAQISAGEHQSNSLNFVGMASNTSPSTRRMDFWVESGAYFRGSIIATGNVTAYGSASDERLKTNIVKIENPIAKLQSVSGYTFDWNENAPEDKQGLTEYGVIAQEVEKAGLNELVFEYERPVNETGGDDTPAERWKAVHYEKFVPILIEAIKEQQEKIEKLEELVQKLISEK